MGHRSRSRSVYYQIANEFIAEPLKYDQLSFTDVVTIIEMRESATITVTMEPCTWQLHNKLVDLAEDPLRGKGHGNYYPSLVEALNVPNSTDNKTSALLLMLLSDGRPSDASSYFKSEKKYAKDQILNVVREIGKKFRERLTFGAFGFAFDNGDLFSFMKLMTANAKLAGANSIFSSGIDTESLRKALRLMSTSLMSTRSNLSSIACGSVISAQKTKIRRPEKKEGITSLSNRNYEIVFNESEYNIYLKDFIRFSYRY